MWYSVLYSLAVALVLVNGRKIVDLTHTLDKDAPKLSVTSFGVTNMTYYGRKIPLKNYIDSDTWLELGVVEFYEHLGTHIDAPSHFGRGRQTAHEIPAERLVGPGVVIDVRDKVKNNIDYAVSVEDILEYEEKYGRIPEGAIVMMNSGWDKRYPDEKLVFGTDDINDFTAYHYPGYSFAACKLLHEERMVRKFKLLQNRWINVLGVDSVSIDPNKGGNLECHKYLQPLNVPLLEYIANLDSIPPNGTTIVVGAPKIRDATGGLTRLLAFVHEEGDDVMNSSDRLVAAFSLLIIFILVVNKCFW